MLSSPGLGLAWSHPQVIPCTCTCSWGLESHSTPIKIASVSLQDNHTAVCAEIQEELMADNITYNVRFFKRSQNTSEELCYGKFREGFISTLNEISMKYNNDYHVEKDMQELTKICPKLKNCTTETSNSSKFKEGLQSVVISIEGWKSCKRTKGIL
uniref:Granulocyte-macrophage colony-stimulating factor n=1 Tax=Balaenoptera musculus TaxID=9771 RepID=A0A8C0DNM9_BALMU